MIARLKKWWEMPYKQDEDPYSLFASMLKQILWITLFFQILGPFIYPGDTLERWMQTFAFVFTILILLILLGRGYYSITNNAAIGVYWLLVSIHCLISGSVTAPVFSAYAVISLWTVFTEGIARGIRVTALSILYSFIIVYLNNMGWVTPIKSTGFDSISTWAGQTAIFLIIILFAGQITHRMRKAYLNADKELKEHKDTQKELERFKEMTERARDIIIAVDLQSGKLNYGNQAALKAYGYTLEEFLQLNIRDLRAPKSLKMVEKQMSIASESGILFETLHKRKDGSIFPVEVNSRRFDFDEGSSLISTIRDVTWRKNVERDLQKEQAFNLAVLSNIGSLVVVFDHESKIALWNQACSQLSGYESSEVLGHYIWEFLLPSEKADMVKNSVAANFREHTPRRFENEWITKNGERRQIAWNSNYLLDEDGQVIFIIDTGQDVTEQRRMQTALAESEALFRSVFEQAAVGILIATPGAVITNINERLCRILGYSNHELIGHNIIELCHPDERQQNISDAESLIRGRINQGVWERRYLRKDGSTVWSNVAATILNNDDGTPRMFFSIIEDISELKHAEAELKSNIHRMQVQLRLNQMSGHSLQELANYSLNEAVCLTDSRIGFISLINSDASFEMLAGFAGSSLVFDLHSWSKYTNGSHKKLLTRALQTGCPIVINDYESNSIYNLQPPIADHSRIRNILILPVMDEGKVVLIATVANKQGDYNDIDRQQLSLLMEGMWQIFKRTQAENALQELNTELEQRVEERTARLEAINKELEAFSYSVSHDLRGPLRSMSGFSQALREDYAENLPAEAQSYLQRIENAAVRMNQLVEDLLRFSRLGRYPLNIQPVNITDIARTVWEEMTTEKEGRTIYFNLSDLPVCNADPALIKQVLINLFSNAVKYTRPRERAEISLGWHEADNEVVYWVKDNGVGFDMQYADRLFGVFQRLHTDRQFEGSGVGLAIVQRIINRHGGRIWFDAHIDQGATFYFTFPTKNNLIY